ncbi:TonB family protein [Bdellovibrio sp. SKB1291214]|uniref:cell envelope integrity protein TolA n=1 Tax=Bdellovibrio sp. SKB1291214 TaxID=1732569 RepID=UPI000B51E162|nr:TonB family protein [Bdellovibrio sp. SKB1291214]UYL10408.1 TonB family protein [Bdellovibrio sp. SKB1291214]
MSALKSDNPQDETLKRGLVVSLGFHVGLVLFFVVKTAFFTPESIDFTQAVRVDMVGLPDKLDPNNLPPKPEAKENAKPAPKPEPSPVEKVAEKKPEPKFEPKPEVKLPTKTAKKDDGVNLEKVKSKQNDALEKLKAMAAIEKLKEEAKKPAPAAGTGKSNAGAAPVKGNQLSPGTALTGLSKLQHDTYGADLDRHIKQHWAVPEWLAKRDLKAQARVFIDSRGNIIDRKIVKSSGNPDYDAEVLSTLDKSSPFPAPPEKFVSLVSVDGILIGFPE